TIAEPVFQLGQLVFGIGVLAAVVAPRLLPGAPHTPPPVVIPGAARAGLRSAGLALVLAAATLAVSFVRHPVGLEAEAHYELLFWGVGHVLQLVSVIAMVSVWILLLHAATGRAVVDGRSASWLFAGLLAPWAIAPVLALQGTWSPAYRGGFTDLMRWGLLPIVSIFLVLGVRALVRARREGGPDAARLSDPRVAAFLVSAALTVLGAFLGAMIRGSTTVVPAHYHASVGGVTVAFMAVTFVLLEPFGVRLRGGRLAPAALWQPILYGVGMAMFAAGFATAGAHGMGRKLYGAEQAARGVGETVGLAVMGLGGFVAIAGGLLFLGVLAASLWSRSAIRERVETELVASSWRWSHDTKHR
ncbi:MAG: hypothetical protein MUF70_17210, partial [Myxococcota bacterium]|nr:hypothetical protein [Myxococcota bacterium]